MSEKSNKFLRIIIDSSDKGMVVNTIPTIELKAICKKYPELSMMIAAEEMGELIQAISKMLRADTPKHRNELTEELCDVLGILMWVIQRFDIDLTELQRWCDYKNYRRSYRLKKGTLLSRIPGEEECLPLKPSEKAPTEKLLPINKNEYNIDTPFEVLLKDELVLYEKKKSKKTKTEIKIKKEKKHKDDTKIEKPKKDKSTKNKKDKDKKKKSK